MFPAFASAAFAAWAPHRVWALRGLTGGPGASRRPRPLRRIGRDASLLASRIGAVVPPSVLAWALSSHGVFRDRASDIPVASPSSSRGASRLREVLGEGRSRRDHRDPRPVTGVGSCDPGCLPSVRALRRIRWPLQPRSRDHRAAFGERGDRWMTLSRHPEPSPIRDRFTPAAVDISMSLRAM